MIRAYLDWNIFSYLKRYKNSEEPYKSLNYHLTKNLDRILVPYSSAHLTDLIASYNKSERGKEETEQDLQYLRELSENKCILYDYKDQKTYPSVVDVKEYFEDLLESETLTSRGFEGLFSASGNADFDKLSNQFLASLDKMPNPVDQGNVTTIPSKFQSMKDALTGKSMLDGLKGIFNLMTQYNEDPKIYRGLRTASLEQLQLNFDYSKEQNPIKVISERLKQSLFNQTFEEFCNKNIAYQFKEKSPGRFDIFTNYYLMLDFFGYHRDKKFKNLVQDSFHAYYGAHCDFFITDDDNTYHKAKTLYDYLNIQTKVCKSHEFNSEFYGTVVLNSFSDKPVLDVVSEVIKNSFVIASLHDGNFNPVDIYKPKHYILNYFNRVQVTRHINGEYIIYLHKKPSNYSSFLFFKEIASIVNHLSKEFNVDQRNRLGYIESIEDKEILDGKWEGREWRFKKWLVKLEIRDVPFGLALSFEYLKPI
jgi:hypothetical protein